MVVADPRVWEEYGGHLLAVTVPQAQPPRAPAGAAVAAALEEGRLRDWPLLSQFRAGVALMRAEAQMEVPRPEIDGQVAVEIPQLRRRLERHLEHRAFDARSDDNRSPIGAKQLLHQRTHRLLVSRHVRICRHRFVWMPFDRIEPRCHR